MTTTHDDDPVVTINHARRLGYCSRGVRAFCQDRGIDWQQFLAGEVRASHIAHIDDAMAQAVATLARNEAGA